MTIRSVLAERYALWFQLLCEDYGYEEASPARPTRSANELAFRAVRPPFDPVEAVTVDIREVWVPGNDPTALGLQLHGCFLFASSWHAQVVPGAGDRGAERLDVDRSKEHRLWVHRHPLGASNGVRVPAAPLRHPASWVEHLEDAIAAQYGY